MLRGREIDIASGSGRDSSDELLRARCMSDLVLMGIEHEAEEIEVPFPVWLRSSSVESSMSSVRGAKLVRLAGSSGMD